MSLILDVTRGLAAIWVFLFHIQDQFEASCHACYLVAQEGHLGVPMFFVISGYVITYSAEATLSRSSSPLAFLRRRLTRIYPVFWASALIAVASPFLIEAVSMLKSGTYHAPSTAFSSYTLDQWVHVLLLTKVFFAQTPDLQAEFSGINAVYWTLAIEVQFYAIVFFCLYLGKYYQAGIAGVTALSIACLALHPSWNYGLFLWYWPMFGVGVGLAYIHRKGLYIDRFAGSIVPYALLITVLVGMTYTITYFHIYGDLAFALLFSILLWGLSPVDRRLENICASSNRLKLVLEVFLVAGTMSYSVYLLHGRLYQFPTMFLRQLFPTDSLFIPIITVILTLAMCYPFFLLVEKRFMRSSRQRTHISLLKET